MVLKRAYTKIRPDLLRAATWAYGCFCSGDSARTGLRILMYHSVGTPIEGDTYGLYNMQPSRFEDHMRYLAEHHKEQLVSLNYNLLKSTAPKIAVTFDDGYQDNLFVAAPILAELDIPFTVFVCTGAVKGRVPGFLTERNLLELDRMPGASIGSHTVDHLKLSDCDDERIDVELRDSKSYLEDVLGHKVDALSYPHGSVDRRVRDKVENSGYRIGATSRFDVNRSDRDPLLLCRTHIDAQDDVLILEQKLRGVWDWNRWRSVDPSVKM